MTHTRNHPGRHRSAPRGRALLRGRKHVVGLVVASMVGSLGLAGLTATSAAAADNVTFRASAQSAANQATQRVTIPAAVQATDGLLLFVTSAKSGVSVTTPSGWTLVGSRLSSTDTRTSLFSKVAVAADAGRSQAVTFSATTKATLTVLAYDGTAVDNPVAAFASAAETTRRSAHTTPGATVSTAGSYVVSYWADKSSSTTGWTLPAGQTQRSLAVGTGTGRVTSVASDLNSPAPTGASPAVTATASASSRKATMWTVVLKADEGGSPNVAPVAAFTTSCPQATCTVDASGSTDTAPGTVASYAWNFGDGTTGTGVTATHTYATAGSKTISLVVTDDQGLASAPVSHTVNVTLPPPSNGPGHTRLVPDKPRTNTPRISDGEIWDMEVVGTGNAARVFIAGTFTSAANTISPTTTINQPYLLSYNLNTGLIDTAFRPTFGGGGVTAVEATPDGSKLFVAGSFNTVNGVARQKVASLNLTTGATISTFAFTQSTNNQAMALAASNSTLYVGGRFTRINGQLHSGLAAVNTATGAVDPGFVNDITGGIGVNGALGVQQLKLTHDGSKLLVVHTGRQINGQDRLGMGLIDTATKQLLPWRSQLWDEYLASVGGVTRIYAGDIAPDDSYFVVSSGSGGDRPPISDTVVAYPMTPPAGSDESNVQPLWISRHFDSIYSVAITEVAVYVGGHFSWNESPTSDDPWPGLDNVGYGTGQGLSGYGLGDQVVRRDHIGALSPTTGKALEWYPMGGSNSFEGDKAMEATPRGLLVGGDGMFKGGVRTGRVAFFDFNTVPFPAPAPDTTITTPIEGRVVANNTPFMITGTARVASGTVGRVQVEIKDRDSNQYLQDDGSAFTTTFSGTANTLNATLDPGTGTTRTWSIPATIATNRNLLVSAQAFTAATGGSGDTTKATKKIESFSVDDQTPTTSINGPSGIQSSTTFTMTGTANDDKGVNSLSYWFRDEQNRYLQDDGTVDDIFNTFRGTPDVIGATSATWSYEVTLPHEGTWRGSATATDTIGQADLRSATRDWLVSSTAVAPSVTIEQPVSMTPPFAVPAVTVEPGGRLTFSGTALDDEGLHDVEVSLRNTSTGENLGSDGTWGLGISAGNYRVSPVDIGGLTYNWSYTTPFNLTPGTYSFSVRATDDLGLTTSSANRGSLTINAQYAGNLPPDTTMTFVAPLDESLTVNLAGTATDDFGVQRVRVSLQDRDTGRYLQANGTMAAAIAFREATLTPNPTATNVTWALPSITLPTAGNWRFSALADDVVQQDPSAATANYAVYPNDGPPTLSDTLGQPQDGATFTDGKIVVTGRAEDALDANASIASVRVGIVNAVGQYMSSTGTFTSTTPSYRNAFLNSPGSEASNYSYTTPVIPAGTYSVVVQPVDVRNQVMDPPRTTTGIVVTQPANLPPVASFTYSCNENVCVFDGRGSTDENPTSLTYSWNFGGQGTATGPLPTKTFTAPSPAGLPFQVTLTVRDEWTVTNTSAAQGVTIVEPAGNSAPVPTFVQSCTGLTCAVSSQGTVDPNTGDVITYSWNWGDGTTPSTGAAPGAHLYAGPGSYTITLTTTDGWGNTASTARGVTLSEPAGNQAPTVVFGSNCPAYTTCLLNSAGTVDPDGDTIKYLWDFGDGATSTSANPTRIYLQPGSYQVSLTVTDAWGKATTVVQTVTTLSAPAGNAAPTVVSTITCPSYTTCTGSTTGSSDPEGHTPLRYVWNWGDGTPDSTTASPSHTYNVPGTYTVTLTVTDAWGQAAAPVMLVATTPAEPGGNVGPIITFAAPACNGLVCTVSASGTTDPDGIRGYSWDWGDGTTPSTGTTAAHTYATAGIKTITLTATDRWGRTSTMSHQVVVT